MYLANILLVVAFYKALEVRLLHIPGFIKDCVMAVIMPPKSRLSFDMKIANHSFTVESWIKSYVDKKRYHSLKSDRQAIQKKYTQALKKQKQSQQKVQQLTETISSLQEKLLRITKILDERIRIYESH